MDKPPLIPMAPRAQRFFLEHNRTDNIRVRLEPQHHEIVFHPDSLRKMPPGMSPEQAREQAMIQMLRAQAGHAYRMVMQAGLTALASKPVDLSNVDFVLDIAVEEALKRAEVAENDRDNWKELAERRKVEVETLERVLRRGER